MGRQAPEGWIMVLEGSSLELELARAVLESSGLHPVLQGLGVAGVFAGSVFEDARLFVPDEESADAERILSERI